jgi:hypothetical protein
MRIGPALVSIVAMVALTACGSNNEPSASQVSTNEAEASVAAPEPESPSEGPVESEAPTDDDLRKFVDLISTNQPTDLKRALKLTAPGSAAHSVVTVWHARYAAGEQAGFELPEPRTVTGSDGSFDVCSTDSCQTYGTFLAQGPLIADFALDGKRIRDRVILGSKKVYSIGDLATARLIGSYRFVSDGSLAVYLEVTARTNVTFGWSGDSYVGPDGAQVGMTEATSPGTLRPGARAIIAYYFPTARLGGDIFITAVEDGGAQRDVDVTIPTG